MRTDGPSAGGTGPTELPHGRATASMDQRYGAWPPEPPIAIHSAARNYFSQGTVLLATETPRRCRSLPSRRTLHLNPDDADVLNNLGTAVWEQGRVPEAMAYYLRAHQFKPRDFGILNNLGIALWDQGRPERAVTFYRRALEIEPNSFDTRMNLGVSLSDLGQFDEALDWIRSSLEIQPDSADAWDNVGMTLARQGHWAEAMAHYDQAIELRPDFGEAHRNRALGWLAHGDFERGWPEAEWRLKCRNPPGFRWPRPRWTGEPSTGGRSCFTGNKGWATPCSSSASPRRSRSEAAGSGSSASRPWSGWSPAVPASIGCLDEQCADPGISTSMPRS